MKIATNSYFDFYQDITDEDFLDIFTNEYFLKEWKFQSKNLEYLFKYIKDLKCKTIIVEKNYIDRDYLIDYSKYYVRCLRDYHRKCKRMHFFNDKKIFNPDDFINLISNSSASISVQQLNDAYLGFLVIRPLPETIIARTILQQHENDVGACRTCVKDYEVNLYGISLNIKNSLAFQEQDAVTSACATSALWSAFHKTHELFKLGNPPTPSQITDYATEVLYGSRPITSRGLTIDQMCQAIHKVGLEPHVISLMKTTTITPVLSFIYSYIRGGIPVILVFTPSSGGKHAITISGYKLGDVPSVSNEVDQQSASSYCKLIGLRISKFYVHDDQFGPFAEMDPIDGDTSCPINFQIPWNNIPIWGKMKPYALIIPLYPKIRVCFLSVYKWISYLNLILGMSSNIQSKDIEWEIYFSTLKSYKEDVRNNYAKYDKQKLLDIQLTEHPRFVWRCIGRHDKKDILEVIADATDTPKSLFLYDMVFFKSKFKNDLKTYLDDQIQREYTKTVYTENFVKFLQKSVI